MGTGENETARLRIGRHRPVALPGNDSIYDCEIPQWLFSRLAAPVEGKKALVEVENHAPAGVIAVPVAGTNHLLRVAENEAARLLDRHEQSRRKGAVL